MANYPNYPPAPAQRRPVPGQASAYGGQVPPHSYAQAQAPPQAQPYPSPPWQQEGGPPPALPPRPAGTPNRLMAHTTLNFPPPPRSPNRPPALPPRPKAAHQTQPAAASAPPFPQGYYPPPPPGPPPPRQSPPLSTTSTPQADASTPSASQANPARMSPPPPYTSSTRPAPVEKHPAPPAATAAPAQPPPQVYVHDTEASTSRTASISIGDDSMLSMIERLKIRPPSPTREAEPAPAPKPAPVPAPAPATHAFVAELPAEPIAIAKPASSTPAAPQPSSQQETRAGPRPAYVTDVPDEEPPASHPSSTDASHAAHTAEKKDYVVPPPPPAPPVQPSPAPPTQPTAPIPQQPAPPQTASVPRGSAPPPFRPAMHCIDTPVTFATWWYSHEQAPGVYICSKCYTDHIHPTAFRNMFSAQYCIGGEERQCRFNVPRITDQLLPDAVARGTLDTLILFMNQRLAIKDCKGAAGAKRSEGVKWYEIKDNQLPGFVSCEACYQDIACISQFAYSFQEAAAQPETDLWICDLCVPFTRREYERRTKANDWPMFVQEAKARLGLPACPESSPVAFSTRKWFVPVSGQGPPDATLCCACFCDYIIHSGQEGLWREEPQQQSGTNDRKTTNVCMMGRFHLRLAVTTAEESKDWPLYWSVLNRIAYQEKNCVGSGIVDGHWYTFPSQPEGFNVCGACHAGVLQSLHLDPFLVPRTTRGPPPGAAHVCALNPENSRFRAYASRMLQTLLTADGTAWEDYARQRAAFPSPCPRNADAKNRAWFGWPACVICPDCYADVVRGTALDSPQHMTYHHTPTVLEAPHICEMYSPRMRKLYAEACAKSPPDPSDMFAYVERRRMVYWQTIPVCRQMLMEQKLLASQSAMHRVTSSFYNAAGGIAAINNHHSYYTYGMGGQRFENAWQLEGAQYNARANALSSQVGGSKTMVVGQLEQQWLAIE